MKKFVLQTLLIFSILTLCSCEKADVVGKHFRFSESDLFCIDFSANSNKVYYITGVGDYVIDKSDVAINFDGKEIRLRYKENALYPFKIDDDGKQTKDVDFSVSFVEDGKSDFFVNVLENTEKECNGIVIKFTANSAQVGEFFVDYSFDENTGMYAVADCEETHIREKVLDNVYSQILKRALDGEFSELSYSDAFWLCQGSREIDAELMDIYLNSFYKKEYKEAYSDDFAFHKLVSDKQDEVLKKIKQLDAKKTFNIIMPASLGKYDFKNGEFLVNTSLDIPEIASTFSGCDYPVQVVFGQRNGTRYLADGQKTWNITALSNINSKVKVKMQEDKASELSKKNSGTCLIVYTVRPIMLYNDNLSELEHRWEMGAWDESYVRERYAQYYEILSADLLDGSSLEKIGEAEVVREW